MYPVRWVDDKIMEEWQKEIKWAKKHGKSYDNLDDFWIDIRK